MNQDQTKELSTFLFKRINKIEILSSKIKVTRVIKILFIKVRSV